MRSFERVITGLVALALGAGAVQGYNTYAWTKRVDAQAKAGTAAYEFLASPVRDPNGKPLKHTSGRDLTHADAIATLIRIRVEEEVKRQSVAASGAGAPHVKDSR
jgi:hypothetical protein